MGERGETIDQQFPTVLWDEYLKTKKSQIFFLKCGYVIIECILLPCNKKKKKKSKKKTHLSSRGEERTATGRKFPTTFFFVLIIIVINLKKNRLSLHKNRIFFPFPFLKIKKTRHNLANEIFLKRKKRSRE